MSEAWVCFLEAAEVARLIRTRELSAEEVTGAYLGQIGRTNPHVNAIVTLVPERAMRDARAADERLAEAIAYGEDVGLLHGLPVAHKDLAPTRGIRTTFGSPVYEDFVPDEDALVVERLRRAGAITIGKTNTPEFGAGSQTYNEVFGETLNPFDTTRTCGGSSGGAAAALACGMVPIADADEVFKTLRAWHFELNYGGLLEQHRNRMKETVVWNIEQGVRLSGPEVGRAERGRTALYHRVLTFMEDHEFLVAPVCQVPPFDVKQRYVTEINSMEMETYIDWMKSCYYVTVTGLPAISVPCGYTPEGLPVGVQIVGRHRDDLGVLQLAHAFELATGFGKHRPPIAA